MEYINIEGIPESMIKALYARANEAKKPTKFIDCKKSQEVVASLGAEAAEKYGASVMGRGAIARSILLDKMVKEFIEKNPTATIVNIACGADTRFYRVDNGRIRWYNMDLPVTIEARKRLMDEGDRVFFIEKGIVDESWAADVQVTGPVLVIAETLSMYLTKNDVQKIFSAIRKNFTEAEVFMEVTASYIVKHATEGSGENNHPKYSFGVKKGKELQKFNAGFKWVKDVSLLAGLRKMYPSYYLMQLLPSMRRMSNKIVVLKRVKDI